MTELPQMLTARECAKQTGLAYSFILHLCKTRKISWIKSGNRYLVNSESLFDYLTAGERKEMVNE